MEQKPKEHLETITVIDFYEKNGFGTPSPYRINEITEWVQQLGKTKVLNAMQVAIDNRVAHWDYVHVALRHLKKSDVLPSES